MSTTEVFAVPEPERRNYADMLAAMWRRLKWRHAGFGALQAYIREGGERELRVHVWHPSLVKAGIEESGLCHDHRFDMRSTVIAGRIVQTDFQLDPSAEGDWETHRVLHAREAMARGGSFHHGPVPTGDRFRRVPQVYGVGVGDGYTFAKFAFHETRAEGITITLVEKAAQEDVHARILAPVGKPIVHAFTETRAPSEFLPVLVDAYAVLIAVGEGDQRGSPSPGA